MLGRCLVSSFILGWVGTAGNGDVFVGAISLGSS